MNLQQAKIILEKINRLYQSMTLDAANIDVFEQDLMLSYVAQLHDAFSPTESKKAQKRPERRPQPRIPVRSKPEPPAVPAPPPAPEPQPEPVVVKKPTRPAAPPKPAAPKASVPTPPPAPEPPVEVKKTPPPAPRPAPTPEVKKTTPPPAPPKPTVNPDHDILFEQKEARELSEKLSAQPIGDLNRAMGINERFLTINELFDRDNQAYEKAVTRLNGLRNFDEAKPLLSELAEKHGWTQKDKKKKAQIFIKLVRRRYL